VVAADGRQAPIIDPGKPIQNPFAESLIGKFRDECLNDTWFRSLPEARRIIEAWRIHYNTRRPHSSLGYLTPVQYAARGGAPRLPEGFAPRPLADSTETMLLKRSPSEWAYAGGKVRSTKMITAMKSLATEVGKAIEELVHWLLSLDPSFAFLLVLPFLVGLAGLLSEYLRKRHAAPHSTRRTNHGSP